MRDFRTPAIAAFCTALLAACNGGSSLTGSMSATDSSSSNNSGGISVGSPGTSTPSNPTSPGGGGVAQSFELSLSGLNTGESVSVSLNGGRIGISNARPVQGCPPPLLERNQPYVASKLRSRVAGPFRNVPTVHILSPVALPTNSRQSMRGFACALHILVVKKRPGSTGDSLERS